MKHRSGAVLVLAALGAVAVTACGSSADSSSTSTRTLSTDVSPKTMSASCVVAAYSPARTFTWRTVPSLGARTV